MSTTSIGCYAFGTLFGVLAIATAFDSGVRHMTGDILQTALLFFIAGKVFE